MVWLSQPVGEERWNISGRQYGKNEMGQVVDAVNGMMCRADIGEEYEWSILNALTNGVAENFLERVWDKKWDG